MTFSYVFCGPSLEKSFIERAIAKTNAPIILLPPARQGDILRILADKPRMIGLIDGYFFQQPAVHFKEILLALESGIAVLGAASMGALRAAELSIYGMEGIGRIYEMYAKGVLEGDDEVAVLHTGPDDGYRSMSEALVNVRVNVRKALQNQVLDRSTANAIVNAAKGIHFTERTYHSVFSRLEQSDSLLPSAMALRSFRDFIDHKCIDQKREDSIALINNLISRTKTLAAPPSVAPFRTPRTSFLKAFEYRYIGRWYGEEYIADHRIWSLGKLLTPRFELTWQRLSLRCLAIDEAKERGFQLPSYQILLDEFQHDNELGEASELERWLKRNCMNVSELSLWLQERWLEAALKKLHAEQATAGLASDSYSDWLTNSVAGRLGVQQGQVLDKVAARPGLAWEESMLREEKATGGFANSTELACKVYAFNSSIERDMPGVLSRLGGEGLEKWFAARWGVRSEEMGTAIRSRGFNTMLEFYEVARVGFLFDALGAKPLLDYELDAG